MASNEAKTGSDKPRKGEKKFSFQSIPTRPRMENSKKKIAKKLKKLKNNIIASFQAKMGWEKPRKREK